ncbi:MAG: DPP IV N-terminal domain-containing protein, partial [Planctomycetes bacterium]|nr:DPP IV N-terminal domain-containing protein [Planctomycetota bacterium]
MHRRPLLEMLRRYTEKNPDEADVANRIERLVTSRADCFERACRPGHITGSAWVLSHDRRCCLLVHHAKLNRWLQPGGHADGQTNVAEVARREAQEETGLIDLELITEPLDIDVHLIPPRLDRDGNHAWSPDSKRIAFIRRAASSRGVPYTPRREGEPWSIRVADVATRKSHEVWRAEPGLGSVFHGVVSADQLYWSADNYLVFPWERDGWKHLYSVPVANGEATLLTPGEFEVEHVAINADRNVMIYSSNQDDVDRRHIWSVSVSGGEPAKPITSGNGNEWSPAPTGDGNAVAILRSGAKTPARPAIIIASQAPRDLAPNAIPADFPSAQLVTPQQVIFPATDGMPIQGQLFLPKTLREGGRHPAVLFCHGGSRQQMLLGFHYHGYYHNAYALNQYLASQGYIVLSVNYRSGIGYGMNFREAINYGAAGASEYKDVEGAGLYLRRRPDV